MSFRSNTRWLWWLIVGGTLASLGIIGGAAWILYQGIANPPTQSIASIWQDPRLTWGPPTTLAPNTFSAATSPHEIIATDFVLEATAILYDDPLAAWGLWLQTNMGDYVVIGINGSQYVTARLCPTLALRNLEDCPATQEPTQHILTYWKTYHHLHPLGQSNTLQVMQQADFLVLRLNQEWMWDIANPAPTSSIAWGVWVSGGPEGGFIHWVHTVAGVSE